MTINSFLQEEQERFEKEFCYSQEHHESYQSLIKGEFMAGVTAEEVKNFLTKSHQRLLDKIAERMKKQREIAALMLNENKMNRKYLQGFDDCIALLLNPKNKE